jgi:phosphoribosylformylglycinamidine cyclo-ligase
MKYTEDGVNIKEGDSVSKFATTICQSTYNNSPFVNVIDSSHGNFRGPRTFELKNLPEGTRHYLAPDGIGTKVVIIDSAKSYHSAAQDLFAMTCTDISRYGGLPLVFTSVLDVNTLGENDMTSVAFREMLIGLKKVAEENKMVCLNGETAELGSCVSSENTNAVTQFNWAGVAYGVFNPKRMVTGETLAVGQRIIALREDGFRSNGISSVRKALAIKFGDDWFNSHNEECIKAVKAASQPSILYDNFLAVVNGWHGKERYIKCHALAHVSGGGIPSKLFEDLLKPRELSANLDNLWAMPNIMEDCAHWRGMDDRELYQTWNGGQGLLAVVDDCDVSQFIEEAKAHRLQAKVCGEIIRHSRPHLSIISRINGEILIYE